MNGDMADVLCERVKAANEHGLALALVGGGSKRFFGREPHGEPMELSGHRGIVSYEPTELVITARCGTPLSELEAALAERDQMLVFEPPHLGVDATVGGTVACGLSGPRRPFAGAVRDAVLGVKLINGKGEALTFGGQVMKNVAGYDLSRLMCGALGTLGVILEASFKVLPKPGVEATRRIELPAPEAIDRMSRWAGQPLPLSAACHDGEALYLRLSGAESAVRTGERQLGGDVVADGDGFWAEIREQQHPFFAGDEPLWRLAVRSGAPQPDLPGRWLVDWCGGQRWLRTDAPATRIRDEAQALGGHAQCFRGGDRAADVFHPLPDALMGLHRSLKAALDPKGILNPGRLYRDL